MRFTVALLALVPAAFCALNPENAARPSRKGYSTISGVCDPSAGAYDSRSGRDGTLKACTDTCLQSDDCKGLNFMTDDNQCTLFRQECDETRRMGADAPNQNFYLKGEIACATSTVGNEFWLAFMANRVAKPKNMDLEIWITQDGNLDGAVVTLEAEGINREIQVPYKTAVKTTIEYTWKVTDIDAGVSIENKALKLTSTDDFVFYGVNKEYFTADAFLGIPSRALGTRYIANCMWPSFYNCEFAIAPTQDNTQITITLPRKQTTNTGNWARPPGDSQACNLPYQGRQYSNGDSFTITLNQFQVAQIQDPCDLTGAVIEADKPIAVWSGDSRTNIGDSPSRDHQVEELFSTDTWGTKCAMWPTPKRSEGLVDYWVVTAAEDGTEIRVDSNEQAAQTFSLNSGESVRFPASSVREYAHMTSNKKFQAAKYAASATDSSVPGDPAMTLCIPSDQFGFGYTFVTPTGVASPYTNYLSIITRRGGENGFILDGQPVQGVRWESIPNSELVGGFVQLDTSRQQFRIEHRVRGTRFEAYIYGSGDRESIAYPTGACIAALGECRRSTMYIADGKDNDCDGVIDEEMLDGMDNDFDGEVDEDVYRVQQVAADRCLEVKKAFACYSGQLDLTCDEGQISVLASVVGRSGEAGDMKCGENIQDCSGSMADCGLQDIAPVMRAMCNGQQQCSQQVNNYALGDMTTGKCPTCSQGAYVAYVCLNQKEMDNGYTSAQGWAASSWHSASSTDGTCTKGQCNGAESAGSCQSKVTGAKKDKHHPSNAETSKWAPVGWKPASCDMDTPWLEVDFGGSFNIGWYTIGSCGAEAGYVTKFGLSWWNGNDWTPINSANGAMKEFEGISDEEQYLHWCSIFGEGITASKIRVHPLAYEGSPCMHVDFGHGDEVQGCVQEDGVTNSNFANGGTAAFGTSATVECDGMFTTQQGENSYQVACGGGGNWQEGFRPCSRMRTCPDIPRIQGGYSIAQNTMVGSTVKFVCEQGRRLRGPSSVKCGANGQWSEQPPQCEQL